MQVSTYAKCPLCGHINEIQIQAGTVKSVSLINCDVDEGGCDEQFAVEVEYKVIVKTAVLSDFLTDAEHQREQAKREEV